MEAEVDRVEGTLGLVFAGEAHHRFDVRFERGAAEAMRVEDGSGVAVVPDDFGRELL